MLRARCDTAQDYEELRRLVDEPHGRRLLDPVGGYWDVHRIADDGWPDETFPQEVNFQLEWRYTA